jgi:hypothetical protein
MEQTTPQSTPTTYNCPACHIVVRSTDYFCFNCGKNLKPVPLNTSIWKQILLYVGSVILAPFGIIWGFRYLRESNAKAKIIGVLCIILTIITCILLTVYAINIINQAQDELHKQLQNVGY